MAMHWNVKCDGCANTKLVHYRYKCLRCVNYDLCVKCYESEKETGTHSKNHPIQCLLDRAARELFFSGEEIPELCADSFTCPICGKMGHAVKELVKHVQSKHLTDRTPVVCPLCIAMPSADAVQINNLVSHITIIHGTGILRVPGSSTNSNPLIRRTAFNLPPLGRGLRTCNDRSCNLGHNQTNNHGIGCCSGVQWARALGSSVSLDCEYYSHSPWLADDRSRSSSTHTTRETEIDMSNMSEILRQEFPEITNPSGNSSSNVNSNQNPSEAPLASDDVFSDIDSDDSAVDDARIEEYI